MSKVFGRIIFKQINEYIKSFLSNLVNGFHKNHDIKDCLLKNLEKWIEALDNANFFDAIFMDF